MPNRRPGSMPMGYAPFRLRDGVRSPLGGKTQLFTPKQLFEAKKQSVWYDPSDLSTLFQDAAGTTPVTGVEQAVGLMLDKSGRGNHASQTTLAARPVLSARYNVLTLTESFGTGWTKATVSLTNNAATSPIGTNTGTLVTHTDNAGALYYGLTQPAGSYKFVFTLKKSNTTWARMDCVTSSGGATFNQWVNLDTGALGTTNANGTYITSYAVQPAEALANGWFRFVFTLTTNVQITRYQAQSVSADNSGTRTGSFYIWGADLRSSNDGVNLPVYQRVAAATDYDTNGFPPYLLFDGTDDCLYTNAIDLTATDKIAVFAGIRKLSDAGQQVVAELSSTIDSNNGTFLLSAPNSASANFNFSSKGSSQADNTITTYAAPVTAVVTGQADIAGKLNRIRVNGSTIAAVTTDQGSGNYGSYPLYIGRRNNSSLQFNGRLYSLIACGYRINEILVAQTERWINRKMGAY